MTEDASQTSPARPDEGSPNAVRPPQPPYDSVEPGHSPNPGPVDKEDETEIQAYAAKLKEVASQTRIATARNKHASLRAAADQAANELAAAENLGRPPKPHEPVFGEVSEPIVPIVPTKIEPNKGLQRVKNVQEARALAHGGHRVRAADMAEGEWFSVQRRKGQACFVIPATEDTDKWLLKEGRTYYLLPD